MGKKKHYKLTWGDGYSQVCYTKLEVVSILFDLLADQISVKIQLIYPS